MFCVHTLPWYCKGVLVSYDVCRCVLIRTSSSQSQSAAIVIKTTMDVFALQTMLVLLLMAPSLYLSVSERVRTNQFCCEMLLLLSSARNPATILQSDLLGFATPVTKMEILVTGPRH